MTRDRESILHFVFSCPDCGSDFELHGLPGEEYLHCSCGEDYSFEIEIFRIRKKNWNDCPYAAHADDCKCQGKGGDR